MENDVIHISQNSLQAILLVYDSIEDADNGYKSCQCSTFRSFVSLRHEAAQEAYAEVKKALAKSPKKGLLVPVGVAKQCLDFGAALDAAEIAYSHDRSGNLYYRDYLRGVYQAQLNQNAMAALREIVDAAE